MAQTGKQRGLTQYNFMATVKALLLGGGGSGGGMSGGGAGGYQYDAAFVVTPQAYTITVGAGGTPAGKYFSGGAGTSGGDSIFDTITAYGGGKKNYIGTWFDGPHLWPLDFDYNRTAPIKISISETHSGWAFDQNGREMFISQNNRTDKLDAIAINGAASGYDNRLEVASHKGFGWEMSFHYGKMPVSTPGWLFMSSYAKANNLWAGNQLMMIRLAPESEDPVMWRIAPAYNDYNGDYRDEAPAAINFGGDRIYFSSNWGGMLDHREVFQIKLPANWQSHFVSPG